MKQLHLSPDVNPETSGELTSLAGDPPEGLVHHRLILQVMIIMAVITGEHLSGWRQLKHLGQPTFMAIDTSLAEISSSLNTEGRRQVRKRGTS